jgi:hypothetical protein
MRTINYLRVEIISDHIDEKVRLLKIEVLHSGKKKTHFEHHIVIDDFETTFDTIMDMAKEVIKREVNNE